MFFGGHSFTGFRGVNLKGSVAIRLAVNAVEGTMSADQIEASRAWRFPDKSGTFPIMGTFAAQLPAATTNQFSTIVTVSGIRTEDGLVVILNRGLGTYTYGTQGTAYVLHGATPGAGNITLSFWNPGNATGYVEQVYSYVAVR